MDGDGVVGGAVQGTDTQAQAQTQVAGNQANTSQGVATQVGTQRVFTQDELNAIVGDRVKTYKADILRLSEETNLTKKEKADLEAKLTDLECVDSLRKNKVNEDYLDFVKFEAGKLVKDGKKFSDCLVEYLKAHPQYVSGDNNTGVKGGKGSSNTAGNGAENKQQQGIKGSSSGVGSSVVTGDGAGDSYDAIMRKKGYIK